MRRPGRAAGLAAGASARGSRGQVWLIGIAGLFGYHFFYFTALRNAPAVEASLIAYLWPLFIVLGSALMPGEKTALEPCRRRAARARRHGADRHQGRRRRVRGRYAFGYAMAVVCAFVWSAYSLLSRRFAAVPTSVVTWFCAATSVLSLACHFALEETVLPRGAGQWLAVAGLGLMPVGAAFYAWDYGVKHGNIQVLGAASYAAPLLSTLVLIAAGFAEPSLAHPRRLPADHRRRGACRQVAAVPPIRRCGQAGA